MKVGREAKVETKKGEQARGILGDEIKKYLEYCVMEKRLAEGSVKAYEYDLAAFLKYVKNVEAKERARTRNRGEFEMPAMRELLKAYIGELNNRYRVRTVKRKIACLKGFFSYLEEERLIEENPFYRLKIRMKVPQIYPEVMTLREVNRILQTAYNQPSGASKHTLCSVLDFMHFRDIAILEMLFATGLRVHELCNMTFDSYSMATQMLKVIGKGQKERHLYIGNEEVIAALTKYLKYRHNMAYESRYIFLNKSGEKLSCQAVRNLVTKYCHLAGIRKNITPHAFRHTFATLLLEEGVDIRYIQHFLGHSSISTTQIYLHISDNNARKILCDMHPREHLSITKGRQWM